MRPPETPAERDYRAAYTWFLRNDEDPGAYLDEAQAAAARDQREMVSERLQAARGRAVDAGLTQSRMDEIEAEELAR